MSPHDFLSLDDPAACDRSRAGGKAAGLAALRGAGLRTPPGLVVLPAWAQGSAPHLHALHEALRAAFSPLPAWFAVRSSCVGEDAPSRSFAGLHRTHLGVSLDGVAAAVASCRTSAASARTRAYRDHLGDSGEGEAMAVLIQPLVAAEVSGVAFGADPVEGDRNVVVVEAIRGLGEPLVAGRCAPDRYRLRRRSGGGPHASTTAAADPPKPPRDEGGSPATTRESRPDLSAEAPSEAKAEVRSPGDPVRHWEIVSEDRGDQRRGLFIEGGGVVEREVDARKEALLDGARLSEIADAVVRAGDVRGAPQDVEWAIDSQGVVLLQSRPITTLDGAREPGGASASGDILWTRANFREVLPDLPSPALMSLWEEAERAIVRYYRSAGVDVSRWGAYSKCIQGRLYFNATLMASMTESFGLSAASMEAALGHGLPRKKGEEPFAVRWGALRRHWRPALRLAWRQAVVGPVVRRCLRRMGRYGRRLDAVRFEGVSDEALVACVDGGRVFTEPFMTSTLSVVGGLLSAHARLAWLVRGRVDSLEGFVGRMTAPGTKTVSARQGMDLLSLAHLAARDPTCRAYFERGLQAYADWAAALARTPFRDAFARFLDQYGHRAVYESDVARARFREDPAYLLGIVAEALRREDLPSPESLESGRVQEARRAWLGFTARLGFIDRLVPWRAVAVRGILRRIKALQAMRERVRSEGARGTASARRIYRELARRWAGRGWLEREEDFFLLRMEEVRRAAREASFGAALKEIVRARAEERARLAGLEMPNLLRETPSGRFVGMDPPPAQPGAALRGLAVSGGVARGPASVVRTPEEFARMRAGSILVAPTTDPAWSPLFALARGLAVEMGGLLSHGSILAREYGIPAVVNVPGLCAAVRDGEWLEVDGWRGTVRRVEAAAETVPAPRRVHHEEEF